MTRAKKILVIDIGGTNVKILATGRTGARKFPSEPRMTPARMVAGIKKLGRKAWRKTVSKVVKRFISALLLDDVVLGGGNAKKLKSLPPGCRLGDNANAFEGGFRLWEEKGSRA